MRSSNAVLTTYLPGQHRPFHPHRHPRRLQVQVDTGIIVADHVGVGTRISSFLPRQAFHELKESYYASKIDSNVRSHAFALPRTLLFFSFSGPLSLIRPFNSSATLTRSSST
jgi:hypothetical protein